MVWKLGEHIDEGEWLDLPATEPERIEGDLYASFIFGNLCESPIEATFAWELVKREKDRYVVTPQYRWRGWRIDFAILKDKQLVAFVECDGKQFHSSLKRVKNDHRKDAAAAEAGIRMFRFTGSEIFRDPKACAAQVWAEI